MMETTDLEPVQVADSQDCHGLEVRWMASGNVACSLEVGNSSRATDVMKKVREHVGVPIDEQRLFADGQELQGEDVVPDDDAYRVTLVRTFGDPRITNLRHFHPAMDFGKVPRSAFNTVEKISNGINGVIYKYRCSYRAEDDGCVAVKKIPKKNLSQIQMREKDERAIHLGSVDRDMHIEDSLAEIGILSYLSKQADLPQYLIKLLEIFQDAEYAWIVTEFADGGELFGTLDLAQMTEERVRTHSFQMLQAVAYLHQRHIAHRDISLENVLLKNGVVKLIDFGMAVLSHSANGIPLRYFREAGKERHRAPECYVPQLSETSVYAPAGTSSGDIVQMQIGDYLCEVRFEECASDGLPSRAEIWGYQACPADIFSLGVCVFIMSEQMPLWARAVPSDADFAFAYEHGLAAATQKLIKEPRFPDSMQLLINTLQPNPTLRPSATTCMSDPWFAPLLGPGLC